MLSVNTRIIPHGPTIDQPSNRPPPNCEHTCSGEKLEMIGSISVQVCYEDKQEELPLLVVRGTGASLLGRNWQEIHQLQQIPALQETLKRYAEVFENELGEIKGMEARIDVNPQALAHFCKARPVPFALKHKVEAELDRLLKEGIVEAVKSAGWAAPIVPVVKSDGSVRICGDYRMTVNQASRLDSYPLPRVDELFATLEGGKTFSKLDLQHAYLQLPLEMNIQTVHNNQCFFSGPLGGEISPPKF